MTNDINTLNGALKEAGETLAANLTTQGVPSTWDEGLTTLIGKVLDITPTPPTPTPASISLTGTKNILSYADSESSLLTATVLDDNDDPVEGVSVDLYKDSVLWDTLTTGSAGTVSKTYASAGVGDVGFTAECGSLVTETFVIYDDWYYDTYATDKGHWNIQSQATATYDSTYGLKIVGNANSDVHSPLNINYPSEYSVEYEITDIKYGTYGYSAGFICEGVQITQTSSNCLIDTMGVSGTQQSFSKFNVGDKVKLEYKDNQVKVYIDNTLKGTWNPNTTYAGVKVRTYNGWGIGLKNLEIKQL